MQKLVSDYLNELNKKQKRRRKAGIATLLLIVLVVGAVIGTLTQYGVAMTGEPQCGKKEHSHSDSCYTLGCGQEESTGHTHTEDCYTTESSLICTQEESEEHTHDDSCYTKESILSCGQEESAGHTHTEDCYQLSCGMEEHAHDDSCYKADTEADPNADVEDSSIWDAQYADTEWKGIWGEDLAAAARVQLGYRESEKKYTEAEDGSCKGYTRFGQFVNDVYRDYWDTAFVNFCVYYAGRTESNPGLTDTNLFPNEMNGARSERYPEGLTDAAKWQEEFRKINEQNEKALACLTDAAGYEPKAGDLVFFEKDKEDGSQAKESRMGIVSSYNNENGELKVIEGDSDGEVKENTYQTGNVNSHIVRYLDITALESGYKTGWADPEENQTEEPVQTEEGNQTETPEQTEDKNQTETPVQTEDENQTETPVQTEQEITEQPAEYTECLTVADLDELKEQDAGSATENLPGNDLETEGDGEDTDIEDDKEENGNWSFDAYYVNQDDNYDIVKTSNFNLKYQMEFHTSKNFKANEIAIRVKKDLLSKRNKTSVSPDQIAVPQVQVSEVEAEDGTTQKIEVPVQNSHMPFNYRVKEIEGTEYLEFFNYREIPAGTNVAWQVLYKNLKIMEIKDGTTWELKPEIILWPIDETTNEPVYGAETPAVKKSATPLKGEIDSSVKLTSVTKRGYYENGKQYTPGLYTASQVRAYTEKLSPTNENIFFPNGELNKDYYYTVWEVTTKGTATQPWELRIEETPGFKGEIVGYKDNHNVLRGYDDPIDAGSALTSKVAIAKNEKSSWSSRFYVVVAYPKTAQIIPGETEVDNTINITAVPCDEKDQPEEKTARAEYTYKNFKWTYPSDAIGVRKRTDDEKEDFAGWLEVYKKAKEAGSDYGDIPFTSRGKFRGYGYTHVTEGEDLGKYKEDTYYKLITADDIMYAVKGKERKMLESEDYYYSSVEITQRDTGYDIWEDADAAPEQNGSPEEQKLIVYAQFGGKDEDADKWVQVGEAAWNAKGVMEYSFTPEQIARQPYRVKAEHASTNYLTTCEIRVKVRMKHGSPVMAELMEGYKQNEQFALTFEDLSGVIGQVKGNDGSYELVKVDKKMDDTGNYNYAGQEDLLKKTQSLYKELETVESSDAVNFPMYRDNASQIVKGLEAHAESNKKLTSLTNDVGNRRGQVVYSLTAQDGYDIYSEQAVTELKRRGTESPGRQKVVFYDLLPEGMTFDPSYTVTAGRITNFDTRKNYTKQPGLWDDAQVTVTWETVDNYRGTSRMMVIFHIVYDGQDAAVYSNKYWAEGWGVSFRAYYDWDDTDLVQKGTNISAFMPGTEDPKYTEPLCGTTTEVAMDNGVIVPGGDPDFAEKYVDFGADIDGDNRNDNIRNVLYAQNSESEDIAQSFQSSITKLVRADTDKYSSYRTSAVVEEGGDYTYDIRVSTTDSELKDIIIYDHLENAKEDRPEGVNDPNAGFADQSWYGVLQSVTTSGLTKLGVKPVVYYSPVRNAEMLTLDQLVDNNGNRIALNEWKKDGEQVWYSENEFEEKFKTDSLENPLNSAQSIAVDLQKKADGEDFVLARNSSVSFRVKMKAPLINGGNIGYAYNSPAYVSRTVNDVNNELQFGDSTKVSRKKAAGLEVIKEFGSEVPDSVKDTTFEFILTDKRQKDPKPFSYQVYTLYKKDAEGNWIKQPKEEGQYATDGDGLLTLQANEKAEFEKVADLANIEVKEKENIFWKSSTNDQSAEDTKGNRIVTVTNTYRPVLYVRKQLEGVPQELRYSPNWESEYPFTFQIRAEQDGESVIPIEHDFYYVKEIRTDGGVPRIDTSKGDEGKGTLDRDGRFQIHQGEIIALFPGDAGTKYEVKEVSNQNTDMSNDWICRQNTVSGTLPVKGASAVIQNFYRWKALYLTKLITHMSGPCDEEFTFQIQKVVEKDGTKEMVNLTSEEINKLDLVTGTMQNGEFWEDREEGDYPPGILMTMRNGQNDLAGNNVSKLLPSSVVRDETDTFGDFAGINRASRVLIDQDGKFSLQWQSYSQSRTIRIKNLEAGTTYRITELPKDDTLYLPVESSVEVTMPFYGDDKEASITNDYQMRPLSITKNVVSSDGQTDDTEFTMEVRVNGEPLKNKQYMVMGGSADTPDEGGIRDTEIMGAEQGNQSLLSMRNSSSSSLQVAGLNQAGNLGDGDDNDNAVDMGTEPEFPTTGEDGTVKLKHGQTVIIIDAGRLGDTFEVIEQEKEGYFKIAPAGNAEGTFAGEGPEVTFVNAKSNGSNLYISKTYETESQGGMLAGYDRTASQYIEELRNNNNPNNLGTEAGKGSVEITLTVDGKAFTGSQDVMVVNQLTTWVEQKTWEGSTFTLDPWSMVIVPIEDGSNVSYTLAESEEDQHRVVKYKDVWLEISQADPKNDRPVTGTVKDNPIAVITNQVKSISGSLVAKKMTADSTPVPEGAELVWRVEAYNTNTMKWEPAEGVSYFTLSGDWSNDFGENDFVASLDPACDRLLTTGPDGKIVLTKGEDEKMPAVYFDRIVRVNQYEGGRYRVVEVMEESDEAWGMLKGYIESNGELASSSGGIVRRDILSQGLRVSGFVNSNETAYVDIAKEMDETSDAVFTMILKQVLSLRGGTELDEIQERDITASEGRSGIPYTVYDTATKEAVGYKETGKNGEIQLKAGQFARLNLSNTLWTVSEEVGHTYKLTNLTPENSQKMKRLNPNLMLINCLNPVRYTVTYKYGQLNNDNVYQEYQVKEGNSTPRPDNPTDEKYTFTRWEPEVADTVTGDVTYTAQWKEKKKYTVSYTDGVEDEIVFPDQNYEGRVEGSATPGFDGTPTRPGYEFGGWSPTVKDTVDGTMVNSGENKIVYTATWQKVYTIVYNDGVGGIFGEESHGKVAEGDSIPYPTSRTKRNGYWFAGWYPTSDGNSIEGYWDGSTQKKLTSEDIKRAKKDSDGSNKIYYYARWVLKDSKITYRYLTTNGLSSIGEDMLGRNGQKLVKEFSSDMDGTLLGWSTRANCYSKDDVEYEPGKLYFFSENIDLYAVYEE